MASDGRQAAGTRGSGGHEPGPAPGTFNEQAAGQLEACGRLLREQQANPFRVNAYLRAAKTLRALERDVRDILEREGVEGLQALPGIGRGLAAAIEELARTGRLSRLDRLRGATAP